MDDLKRLLQLIYQRKMMFNENGFGPLDLYETKFDKKYDKLTKEINRLANKLTIYSISLYYGEVHVLMRSMDIFEGFSQGHKIEEILHNENDLKRHSINIDDEEHPVKVTCFRAYEEHKKAQAI